MSILIKGMEMPKRDERYTLVLYGDGRVFVYKRETNPSFIGNHVTSWDGVHVSARKLPPHGRLIDADVLPEIAYEHMDDTALAGLANALKRMPTIIEAEV